jgi:hypothetical protein
MSGASRLAVWIARFAGAAFALAVALSSVAAQTSVHVPPAGSTERKAILDAMRALGDNHDRIFVVRYIKVAAGWAWITVNPQSADGKQHYETESALLQKAAAGWKVVDQPCSEGDCDDKQELARIRAKFPAAPAAIFPDRLQHSELAAPRPMLVEAGSRTRDDFPRFAISPSFDVGA